MAVKAQKCLTQVHKKSRPYCAHYSALNEVLNGKRTLNPELAMMMEAALGVDAAPLLAMQNEYDMLMAERNESFMEKLKHLRRIAAIF